MMPINNPADRSWFIEEQLISGVLTRRFVAWVIDMFLAGVLVAILFTIGLFMGLLTFGLTLPMLGALPVVPLLYHWLTMAGPMAATPGQALLGITVRDAETLAPPGMLQSLGFVLLLYVTLAFGAFWVLIALFTTRHRTIHDMLSGVVVIRTRALTMLHDDWNMGPSAPYTGRTRA